MAALTSVRADEWSTTIAVLSVETHAMLRTKCQAVAAKWEEAAAEWRSAAPRQDKMSRMCKALATATRSWPYKNEEWAVAAPWGETATAGARAARETTALAWSAAAAQAKEKAMWMGRDISEMERETVWMDKYPMEEEAVAASCPAAVEAAKETIATVEATAAEAKAWRATASFWEEVKTSINAAKEKQVSELARISEIVDTRLAAKAGTAATDSQIAQLLAATEEIRRMLSGVQATLVAGAVADTK